MLPSAGTPSTVRILISRRQFYRYYRRRLPVNIFSAYRRALLFFIHLLLCVTSPCR